MILKNNTDSTFNKLGRSATLAIAILLAASACTTQDDAVATIDAAVADADESSVSESNTAESDTDQSSVSESDSSESDTAESDAAESETPDSDTADAPATPTTVNSDESSDDAQDTDTGSDEDAFDYGQLSCFDNAAGDLALLNLPSGDMAPFTGVITRGNSVIAVSGDYANGPDSQQPISFNVSVTAVGAAEDGGDSVTHERWVADGDGSMFNLDGSSLNALSCIDVDSDRITELQQFVGDNYPPMPTSATDMGTVRTCYIQGDDVLVITTDLATSSFTGARTYLDSVEAIAGRITEETLEDRVLVEVNVSPLGSAEEDGGPIVNREQWDLSYQRAELFVPNPNRMFAQVADCDNLGERVVQLDRLVGSYPEMP